MRLLARSPGFATAVVLCLALGIGANTAIFSILNALLVRPLPVRQPEQLVQISGVYRNGSQVPFSFPTFQELARGQRVFSELFGWSGAATFNVEAGGTLFPADVRAITGNYFEALGTSPAAGRLITPADDTSAAPVAVIGKEFWEQRLGRNPAVIGTPLRIEGHVFTIIGVTERWFTGMTLGQPPEVTIPIHASPLFCLDSRSSLWVFATGRLNSGVTLGGARSQLASFWPEVLQATVPTQSAGARRQSFLSMRLRLEPAAKGVNPALRAQFARPLYLLLGIAGLILLATCVNCANLMLARAATRRSEMCTRLALGASHGRILSHLLAESLSLSAAGAAIGLALAYWGSRFLVQFMMQGDVRLDVRPDGRVLAFAIAAAAVTALFTGLVPAWRMAREEPAAVLRSDERSIGRGTGTLGKALIVTQIAVSLVLLQGAAVLLRELEHSAFHRYRLRTKQCARGRSESPSGIQQRRAVGS